MRQFFIAGVTVSTVAAAGWLWAGGGQCTSAASACGDKTALVSADAPNGACAEASVATKSCEAQTVSAKSCDSSAAEVVKANGSCCPENNGKASLVSLEPNEAAAAPKALDALKPLAGKWRGESEHGTGELEFKVVSAGSAIVETMFPGQPHEMTNVYVMDGDDLLVTHYCAAGNAPRMKMAKSENGTMTFEFLDATNLKDKSQEYMGGLVLTINGDKLTQKWISYIEGKQSSEMEFTVDRVK
ncbi:MAG TPA: hypothetical protein PLD59_11615 [Tepidisphaeraceae bacterium]|nr:hypothetical protein [Tepidisphaeraceae bacterium]